MTSHERVELPATVFKRIFDNEVSFSNPIQGNHQLTIIVEPQTPEIQVILQNGNDITSLMLKSQEYKFCKKSRGNGIMQLTMTKISDGAVVFSVEAKEKIIQQLQTALETFGVTAETTASRPFLNNAVISKVKCAALRSKAESTCTVQGVVSANLNAKQFEEWSRDEMKEWLLNIHLFKQCSKAELKKNPHKKHKKTDIGIAWIDIFLSNCPTGESLQFVDPMRFVNKYIVDYGSFIAYFGSQLQVEMECVLQRKKFDKKRRAVFHKIMVISDKPVSKVMKTAEILSNDELIRKHYFDQSKLPSNEVEISIILSKLPQNVALSIATSCFSIRYGLHHPVLRVGPWILDWNDSSLCEPKLYEDGIRSAHFEYQILKLDISKQEDQETLNRFIECFSKKITEFNCQGVYSKLYCNCQDFVDNLLFAAKITVQTYHAVTEYLEHIRKTSTSSMALKFNTKFKKLRSLLNEVLPTHFCDLTECLHATIDLYIHKLDEYCRKTFGKSFAEQYPGEHALLDGFCNAHRLRFIKNLQDTSMTHEERTRVLDACMPGSQCKFFTHHESQIQEELARRATAQAQASQTSQKRSSWLFAWLRGG